MRLVAVCLMLVALAACSPGASDSSSTQAESQGSEAGEQAGETVELQRSWEAASVVDATSEDPGASSAAVSRALFVSSPSVILALADDQAAVDEAAQVATDEGVPLLLLEGAASSQSGDDAASTSSGDSDGRPGPSEEIERLEAQTALVVGSETRTALDPSLDVDVVDSPEDLPSLDEVDGLPDLTVLVHDDVGVATSTAARATATAAGATAVATDDADIRADADLVTRLADTEPEQVVGVGGELGPAQQLASRVELAKTGVQLPGGGQALFPGRRLIAMYGTPGSGALGVLGEQDVEGSIARAEGLAAEYDPLTDVPAVPTFEIIATIASSSAGSDGDYSTEVPVSDLRPWVERAQEEGVYVVLDLQPGRSNFLDQAKRYEELLRMPHVGLALDPEWRLGPTELPLQRIGSVEAEEVNSVITWLADLTAQENLPQKLLVLHQFRISMLPDSDTYDLSRDEVRVLIHMDGQGPTGDKEATWAAVTAAAPDGMPFGWKNFYDEDSPMLSPEQTMDREPVPFMVSYQ